MTSLTKKKNLQRQLRRGLTIVMTGDGKGKTTAAIGLAVRALGHGMRVLMIQFMKKQSYGEHAILRTLKGLTLHIMGSGFCRIDGDVVSFAAHRRQARCALRAAHTALRSRRYDMIILDEINCAFLCKLVSQRDLMTFVKRKPEHIHLVLTGRGAPRALIACADLVSRVDDVKHPYRKGITAQAGIEF